MLYETPASRGTLGLQFQSNLNMKTSQERIHNFIKIVADQLKQQISITGETDALLSPSSTALKSLLNSAIQALPETSLKKSLLQHNDTHLIELLLQALQQQKRPKILSLQSRNDRINAVKNEVDGFLKNFRDGSRDASNQCRQNFSQMLMLEIEDPPVELLWSFAAVKLMEENCQTGVSKSDGAGFRVLESGGANSGALAADGTNLMFLAADNVNSRVSLIDGVNTRVSVAKTLFQCLAAFTVGQNCSASASIAALVPVIVILVEAVAKLAVNSDSKALSKASLKNLKNIRGEIVGYIAICGNKRQKSSAEVNLARALTCCAVLLSSLDVWEREKALTCSAEKNLEGIFPFSSAGVRAPLLEEGCNVDYLASVVILEASLLQLVVEVIERRRTPKEVCGDAGRDEGLRQNLRTLAVNSIGTAKNAKFFDILLELLLESNLPVASLLSQEEELLLRGVLYEVTTLVDYAFLKQNRESISTETKSIGDNNNRTLLNRLVLAQKAVQLLRSLGEHSRALSFSKTFSNVPVTSDLMKWISQKSELKYHEALTRNPQALVGYLVNLGDQKGLKQILNKHPVFNTNSLPAENIDVNLCTNATTVSLSSNLEDSKEVEDELFFVDTKGEVGDGKGGNEFESVGKSFVRAAHGMGNIENDGKKKRNRRGKKMKKINFQRHVQHYESTEKNSLQELGSDLSMSEESDLESSGFKDQSKKSRTKTQASDG
ncbi:hypothetical protein KI387_023442, partial [Taxus chinensis]